jgi:hypothetical protein
MASVTNYRIVRNGAIGDYGVEVTSPGHFRAVNGFRTERDAQDWIEQQRANEAGAGRILQT